MLTLLQPPSYGVSLEVCGYDPSNPKICGLSSAEINKLLVAVDGAQSALTSIRFAGNAWNVDIFAVRCRAYGDREGTIPVAGPFNNTFDLDLGEKPVGVYSILCYIVDYEMPR